ncbi:MAG: hypothetical protein A3F10_00595 [Coxiella sp. RIFCSPHIGHO2_12_FULL_42_15]|nr:MAG: hypothetical protein A3F10_00595 [Coxiella sp. RIFCSPHIGHO2_12_FULL_42_15]
MVNLNKIFEYKNQAIFNRYTTSYPNNQLNAENAFKELAKYLWLTYKHQKDKETYPNEESLNFNCSVFSEMSEIDDMWHTFLLFTKDYMNFCHTYFGCYMHHVPTEEEKKLFREELETDLGRYLSYVYDHLGADTIKTWFLKNDRKNLA